jgi:DNA-binding PucR family transcriptional regulator
VLRSSSSARCATQPANVMQATYFREGTNLARTARALYVHPNTVVKRLARVADLLGDNWQSPDRALELHMALQLRALADRV